MFTRGGARGRRVHSDSRRFTRVGVGVVILILVRVGSLLRALVSLGSFRFAWVHLGAPGGRRIIPGSRGFTWARPGATSGSF